MIAPWQGTGAIRWAWSYFGAGEIGRDLVIGIHAEMFIDRVAHLDLATAFTARNGATAQRLTEASLSQTGRPASGRDLTGPSASEHRYLRDDEDHHRGDDHGDDLRITPI